VKAEPALRGAFQVSLKEWRGDDHVGRLRFARYFEPARRAAYVDKFLKGGNPGDLPVEQRTTYGPEAIAELARLATKAESEGERWRRSRNFWTVVTVAPWSQSKAA